MGQAIGVIDRVRPRISYLTHIGHILEHDRLESELPEHVRVGYDGLEVSVVD